MLSIPIALASAWCAAAQGAAATPEPLPSLPHGQIVERTHALAARGAALLPVGRSREGREICALRLQSASAPGKPAILVVADVDGDQPWTSSLALFEAEALLDDAQARQLLDFATVFVIPCANPDAHERRFATPRSDRRATGSGVDDDRDGRQGEDPPGDVDGDGVIASLRVEDPEGTWIADALEPRALVKADARKGERGRWKVWPEGRDLDRDERVAEDAVLDAELNRNFPYGYEDLAHDAGLFPLDEPEARAIADFVLLHPEIALTVTYGSYDNLVEKPKSNSSDAREKLVPRAGMVEGDAELLAELGQRYVELTGNKCKGRGGDAGTLQGWLYAHRGLWSLAIQPWDIPLEAKDGKGSKDEGAAKDEPAEKPEKAQKPEKVGKDKGELSDDAKRLRWIDAHPGEEWRFVPWHEVQHPELGRCEVGGFAPFARSEPPAASSREIARKELDFLLTLGAELPRVKIAELSAKPLGADLYEVKAAVENAARLPLQSASARRTESVRPLRVRLELPSAGALVAGSPLALERRLAGAGGRVEYRWLVRVAKVEDIVLKIDTDHAGCDERRAEVKR